MKRILATIVTGIAAVTVFAQSAVLTQQIIDQNKDSFVVDKAYTLDNKTVNLPRKYTLVFRGGTLNGGTLCGNGSVIKAAPGKVIMGTAIKITGKWRQPDIYDRWFWYDSKESFVANRNIENMLALAADDFDNHIHFAAGRTYYYELRTTLKPNLGDQVSYEMKGAEKKRNYRDLYEPAFSSRLSVFTIPSRTHVTIDCTLQMKPTCMGAYYVFWEYDKHDIVIDGSGTVAGDNCWHLYTAPFINGSYYYGEWGHVFCFTRCQDVTIRDITVSDAFGDNIVFRGSFLRDDVSPRYAERLTLDNVKILRARRNGVTHSARGSSIRKCRFQGNGMVNGTFPKAGIDFESDLITEYPEIGNEDVVLDDCWFGGNARDFSAANNNLPSYGKTATTVTNCYFRDKIHISWGHWVKFVNCTIPSFTGDWDAAIDAKNAIKNTEFVNCKIKNMPEIVKTPAWNNRFVNCSFGE